MSVKVLVSGGTGLVGRELVSLLLESGHEVMILSRRPASERIVHWEPGETEIKVDSLDGFDAIVHLAGESIASGRWTESKKQVIRDSRVQLTENLTEAIKKTKKPPKVIVAASAIGFYGDRGDELLSEDSDCGSGFLASLCRDWENASKGLAAAGIRVVNLRIGVVLSKDGGALAKMLLPFKLGMGGQIGSGKQYMSWISIKDLVSIIAFALERDFLVGPVNAVAPEPVTNIDFTRALGKVLSRPTFLPVPKFGVQMLLGEMADELLIASARVMPDKLIKHGYEFKHSSVETALSDALK